MPAIEAVYENGVFRPLQPVELPEGSRVAVITLAQEIPAYEASASGVIAPLTGAALDELLEHIDSLPLESDPDPDLSTTYRDFLYPKRGVDE